MKITSLKALYQFHIYTCQPAGLAFAIFILLIDVIIMKSNHFD